jgi:uncharacterized protein (TIGR02145 family)
LQTTVDVFEYFTRQKFYIQTMKRIFLFIFLLAFSAYGQQEFVAIINAEDVEGGILTDIRDGKQYKTVKIGNQTWMAENLNYNASGSKCYQNNSANCDKYGRLYNWSTARTACPSGWHLPSDAEWTTLENAVGGSNAAGRHLKATSGWSSNGNGLDIHGFAALPGGDGILVGSFLNVGKYGFWWSATEGNADDAWIRGMYYDSGKIDRGNVDERLLFSVRCLQDS